mgnify:CR=1 FL=1
MTNWMPRLPTDATPRYIAIADSMARDIDSRLLKPGDKLPPQRNLAYDLGVTIGTISRAYALARERGLVAGEVGRGTYVLDRDAIAREHDAAAIKLRASLMPSPGNTLRMTSTAAPDVGQAAIISRLFAETLADEPLSSIDYVRGIPDSWRESGADWLRVGKWRPSPGSVVPTLGVHAGLMSVLAAISAPGDRIAFEDLTYLATVRANAMMGRRLARLRSTDDGIDPVDFERVCAQQHPKAVVIVATINNPTLSTIPEGNRHRIAEIAHRYNVWILEDNTYGGLKDDAPRSFAEIAPHQTFHLGGMSKSVAAGLRAGWVACPPGFEARVINAHRMKTGGAPFTLKEIAARMVLNGEAWDIRDKVLDETRRRVALATRILDGLDFHSDPDSPFIWLRLPELWNPGTFREALLSAGISVDVADEFKTGPLEYGCPYVRIALTGALSETDVRRGLQTIRDIASNPSLCYDYSE